MSSAIFQQVVDATRGEYVVHGTLGQSDALGSAFLAREVATGRSVLLVVPPDAESLDVVAALSDGVPADAGGCAACGFRVGTWVDACPRCERSFLAPAGAGPDVAVLRDQLRDSFDVLASLPHVHGGTVYFGTEVADQRLTAFVVRPQPDGQLTLDVVWEAAVDPAPVPAVVGPVMQGHNDASIPTADSARFDDYPAYDPGPAPLALDDRAVAEPAHDVPVAPTVEVTSARRRSWLPVGLGIAGLAAVGAVAFALTRRPEPSSAPVRPDTGTSVAPRRPDSVATDGPIGPRPGVAGPGAGGPVVGGPIVGGRAVGGPARGDTGGTLAPVVSNADSVRVARLLRRHIRDSVRALNSAMLLIDGDLPTGWTRSVNGGSVASERQVVLTVGVPVTIRIDAPGYCADTLSLTPSPKSRQHWAPTLRGRPTVGDC